jgi:hypothetical protein
MATVDAGLCNDCQHAKRVTSARGSVFFLCGMHDRDARFAKYPRLPMVQCSAYGKNAETAG